MECEQENTRNAREYHTPLDTTLRNDSESQPPLSLARVVIKTVVPSCCITQAVLTYT